jgi:hypothetical protein
MVGNDVVIFDGEASLVSLQVPYRRVARNNEPGAGPLAELDQRS